MVSKDAHYTVLMEALKWFRVVLRHESLAPHEKGLFEAVATMRQEMDAQRRFPPPPPLPNLKTYSSKSTLKDMAATPASGYRNYDELSTIPVPFNDYEDLVVQALKKENPSK